MKGFEPTHVDLSDEYTISVATLSDLPEILTVEHLSQPSPWSEKVFAREFGLDYSRVWLVRSQSEVIAFLVFWVVVDEVHVLNVVTSPDHRRRGIGQSLVAGLIEAAIHEHYTAMTLEVRVSNEAAIGLYRSAQFKEIGRRRAYYADNREDALVMVRILEDSDLEPAAP